MPGPTRVETLRLMRCLAVIPLLIAIAVAPGAAQSLRGRLLDVDSVTPVGGALVLLQDSAGLTIDKGVSNDGGRFQLRAPVAGVYALRVLRIGYAPWQTLVALSAGQTLDRSLLLGDARIALPEIRVEGTQTVRRPRRGDSLGSVLWGQASTALALANEATSLPPLPASTRSIGGSPGRQHRSSCPAAFPTSSLTSLEHRMAHPEPPRGFVASLRLHPESRGPRRWAHLVRARRRLPALGVLPRPATASGRSPGDRAAGRVDRGGLRAGGPEPAGRRPWHALARSCERRAAANRLRLHRAAELGARPGGLRFPRLCHAPATEAGWCSDGSCGSRCRR